MDIDSSFKNSKVWLFVLVFLAILFGVWIYYVAPILTTLPADWSYQAEVVSTDNFFDIESDEYLGPQKSDTNFGYRTTGVRGSVQEIENYFEVKTLDGEEIVNINRTLGINPRNGAHVFGAGDTSRLGYLFGPRMKGIYAQVPDKSSFTYWHVNYDNPINLDFKAVENVYGLDTYLYESNFTSDQTESLGHLDEVGESLGIILDVNLKVWIEPTTGYLVKYKDNAEAFYYDLETGKRLYPWNSFTNQYSTPAIVDQVKKAGWLRQQAVIGAFIVPGFIASLIFGLIVFKFYRFLQRRFSKGHEQSSFLSIATAPFVVFVLSFILTMTGWFIVGSYLSQVRIQEFQRQTDLFNGQLIERLNIYSNVLSGARGLVDASEFVSREEWREYIESLNIEENYPGIQALGYSVLIKPDDLEAHESEIRDQGFPDYQVYPEGERDLYSSIVYIEPFNKRNQQAFGLDMYHEQTRRLAMDQARDLNEATMSGKVTLVQEIDQDLQAGFLIYVPFYEQPPGSKNFDANSDIRGYVYAAFRAKDLVTSTIDLDNNLIGLELYDSATTLGASEDRLMFRSSSVSEGEELDPDLDIDTTIEAAGHTWLARYHGLSNFQQNYFNSLVPGLLLLAGAILSLLVTSLVYVTNTRRARAVSLATDMTSKIRNNQARLETFNQIATLPELDFDQRISKILELATKELGLELGIVSHVVGSTYTVISHYSVGLMQIEDGQKFSLGDTYCSMALENNELLDIADVPNSPYSDHPCYQKTSLSAYIGVPIMVKGSRFGTLNFSSPTAMTTTFSEEDKQFVRLVGLWVGRILEDQQVDKAKTEFVSMASHQLRTPLTAIGWNVELLLSDFGKDLSDQQKELLKDIDAGNHRMVDLVNGLLNISRIELGNFKIEPEKIDVSEVVKSLVKEMKPTINKKELTVKVELESTPKEFVADSSLLRIILQNLLSNALKYTPANGVVTIKVIERSGQVSFVVKDNGYGVPAAEQSQLFTKFYRAENVIKQNIEGTGLGLYIIRSIVDTSGGTINMTSVEGQGSEFTVTYPATGMSAKDGVKQLA